MTRYLIDSEGAIFSAFDEGLVEKFGYPMPDFDLVSYAVRNLGALDVDIGPASTRLRFRWRTVTAAALGAATELLVQRNAGPVVIHCEGQEWAEHQFPSAVEAAAWIADNRVHAQGAASRNMQSTPRELRSLGDRSLARIEEHEDRLALMFKKWRLSHGNFNSDTAEFLVRFGLVDRSLVVAESSNDGGLVFEHVGSGFALYEDHDRSWTLCASGRRVEDQPDVEFGQAVARNYRDAIDKGQPQFDYVDSVVKPAGSEPHRFRYNRLLLPWRDQSGTRMLTCTSYNDYAGPLTPQ